MNDVLSNSVILLAHLDKYILENSKSEIRYKQPITLEWKKKKYIFGSNHEAWRALFEDNVNNFMQLGKVNNYNNIQTILEVIKFIDGDLTTMMSPLIITNIKYLLMLKDRGVIIDKYNYLKS